MKKTVLVTGAAGFMGSHLVDHLIDEKYDVHGVDDLSGGYIENVNSKSKFTKLDLRNRETVRIYIEKIRPEIIFHLAADATEGRSQFTPINCTERNYLAYLNLLIPAIKNGMKKIIVTSSMSVYGAQKPPFSEELPPKPEDIYGIAKTAMEESTKIMASVHGFRYTIVRPHNVYGPRQNLADPYRNVVAIFINALLNNKNFYIYGDGNQKRAFTYIDDFTPYISKLVSYPLADREIINVGPEQEYTINELAQVVLKEFFGSGRLPQLFKPVYLPLRPKEVVEAYCTATKAKQLLGYRTSTNLKSGVAKMVSWAKKIGPQQPKYLDELEIISKDTPETWVKQLI